MVRVRFPEVPPFDMDFGAKGNDHHERTGKQLFIEPVETKMFLPCLTSSPRLLDIGANLGWYSCIASAATNGRAEVLAFEPEPNNFELLLRNVTANRFHNVRPMRTAIGARTGSTKLYLNSKNPGDHRTADNSVEGWPAIDTPVSSVDEITFATRFLPDLIKIDVQGYELDVLSGSRRTLEKMGNSLTMFIEFWPHGSGSSRARELARFLFDLNHPVYVLYPYEGGQLQSISADVLLAAIDGCIAERTRSYINLLVAPLDYRLAELKRLEGRAWRQWQIKEELRAP